VYGVDIANGEGTDIGTVENAVAIHLG